MKIAIFGIGGVGGYFGGKIAAKHAGSPENRVIFIARGDHLAAIRKEGLLLKTVDGELRVRPDLATDDPAAAGPCDVVLVCVKEYALDETAVRLAPLLNEKTIVLPLLNGVDIAERLRAALPKGTVLSGGVYISAFIEAPGVVRQAGGSCQLFFGPDDGGPDQFRQLESFLQEAGIKAELSERIGAQLWTKYLFVSPMAGVTSLLGKSFGEVMADRQGRELVLGLMAEIGRLAEAKGVSLPPDSLERAVATVERFPHATRSSMQLDYEKGGRTEVDLFIGYAVRAGRSLGVPAPLHEELYAQLKK